VNFGSVSTLTGYSIHPLRATIYVTDGMSTLLHRSRIGQFAVSLHKERQHGAPNTDSIDFFRWLVITMDRGLNVRNDAELIELARTRLANVNSFIRHDLSRIPYSVIMMECIR